MASAAGMPSAPSRASIAHVLSVSRRRPYGELSSPSTVDAAQYKLTAVLMPRRLRGGRGPELELGLLMISCCNLLNFADITNYFLGAVRESNG